jgi:hypothetical protein
MKLNKKNKILVFSFIVVLYLCYYFAIVKTIHYYREYLSIKETINLFDSNPNLLNQLLQKEKQLSNYLSKYNLSESYQNDLLKQLNLYSIQYNQKIIDFKEPHNFQDKETTISSYSFSLQGSFNGALMLINKIENNPALGNVKHISFVKKRNYKSNTDELFTEVILQKINSIN